MLVCCAVSLGFQLNANSNAHTNRQSSRCPELVVLLAASPAIPPPLSRNDSYSLPTPTPFLLSARLSFCRDILGRGLVTSDGAIWKAHRAVMKPAFQVGALRRLSAIFDAAAGRFM